MITKAERDELRWLEAEIKILENPSNGRCMEIKALRDEVNKLEAKFAKAADHIEQEAGFDCENAPAKHGKPCGACSSCRARQCLEEIRDA
jgi:hypothetical protein